MLYRIKKIIGGFKEKMKEQILILKEEAEKTILSLSSLEELENLRIKYLGKKGKLTELSKMMKDISAEEKPIAGQLMNEVKDMIALSLNQKSQELLRIQKEEKLKKEIIDISLPSRKTEMG